MANIYNHVEIDLPPNIPQNINKKMRKRKQLDALIKFRSTKPNSNDILQTSEDELFLPYQKPSITRSHTSQYHRCWKYSQRILSISFISIFIIVCISLIYMNIELKNQVQSLSLRINEIEEKTSDKELNNILLQIEQIKTRINILERSNFSLIYDQLEKSQIQKLSEDTKLQENESFDQLNSLQNKVKSLNESIKVQELITRLEQLNHLIYDSSDNTSIILNKFGSDLEKLRSQIDQCKCAKVMNSPIQLIQTDSEKLNNEHKQNENTTDVERIVNQPSITG